MLNRACSHACFSAWKRHDSKNVLRPTNNTLVHYRSNNNSFNSKTSISALQQHLRSMDYSSGFGSEPSLFGDPTEQPFAQHRPPQTQSESSATLIGDDPLGSPGFATPYSPHIPHPSSDDLDHPGFASQTPISPGFQDDGGFRSPGYAGDDSPAESPKALAHPDQQQHPQEQHQGGEHNQKPETRGQGSFRGQQQRQVAQYKLQAKIVALERTGRKDPILRFDVQVRLLKIYPYCKSSSDN